MRAPTFTIQDVVDFVIAHRRNKVFKGMDENRIAIAVQQAINAGSFGYTCDTNGNLMGVCVATPDRAARKLHVKHILTIAPGAVGKLLETFKTFFDGWTITAHRRGKFIEYNRTPRLCQLLEKSPHA
jgi:hypothetical protein